MKFMFMIYHDENVLDAMPEKEMQPLVDSAIEYAEEIRRSGHYIVSDALQRARTARTIRVRAGGNLAATAQASSMSLASMTKNPPSCSFVSAKGPAALETLPAWTRRVRAVGVRWSAFERM